MSRPHRRTPRLDALESRELLTTVPVEPDLLAPPPVAAEQIHTSALPVHGTLTSVPTMPDVGAGYRLAGSGRLTGFGPAQVKGGLNAPGFIAQGHAGGTVTITGRRGSVRLDLTGPTQPGFSDLPSTFHYVIGAASRAYAGRIGQAGTLHLSLGIAANGVRSFGLSLS